MKKWKDIPTAVLSDALIGAVIGLGAVEFGSAMCADPNAMGFFPIALIVVGALSIASCVLSFLEKSESFPLGLISAAAVLILGLYRVAASKPDVYLLDFLCIVLGLLRLLLVFLARRAQKQESA